MPSCTFCQIVAGTAPARIVYHDEQVTAFEDIHPAAPVHLLVVPARHLTSLNEATSEDESLLGHMLLVARQLAAQEGIAAAGYRLILNTGADGGQTVHHLHLHVIGGQRMRHPMG